jgi:hypothetical protein
MSRYRMSMRGAMLAVALFALVLRWPESGTLALVLALAFVAAYRLFQAPMGSRARRWAESYLVTIACVYLPYSWVVLQDYPWNGYRWQWITLWPILPGLIPGMLCFSHTGSAFPFLMAGFTGLIVALFTGLGSFGRRALAGSGTIALIGSIFLSRCTYEVFLF